MEIAWIGTGIMGAPMARRLLRAGHRVRVHNRSAEKARALSGDGATVVADAAECARDAEAVFIMVSDTPDVEGVVAKLEPMKSTLLLMLTKLLKLRVPPLKVKKSGASAPLPYRLKEAALIVP